MIDLDSYARQMQSFRASDEAREKLVSELIHNYSNLLKEHADLKNDWLSERDHRRSYRTAIEEQKNLVEGYERQLEANSFVLALIDGDGAIPQDALLQAASGDGGSEAASRLHRAIQEHVSSLYSNTGNWPVMVQIYLSLDKLAQKLAQVGLLRSPQELRIFTQRFSVNQPLFSIIDVGQGKERADHKIKEMLRTFSDNPTCRHIIFGGCHDAGYLLNLDQFKHNEVKAGHITLLETTPAYKGFLELPNFKRARFDSVFRTEPLPEPPSSSALATQLNGSASQMPTQNSSVLRSLTNKSSPRISPKPSVSSLSPSTTVSSMTSPPTEANGNSSWAVVSKTGPVPLKKASDTANAAPVKNAIKKFAFFNKAEQRLDEPLPPRDYEAVQSLENRMQKNGKKMCNHWHLLGKCDSGKFCKFQHEPKLTSAEVNVLRYKARSLPCKNRYCENIDCYLGHQCAVERDQGHCHYDNCNFRAWHGMDRTKYVKVDRDGNEIYR